MRKPDRTAPTIDLRRLLYFVALADAGSISAAATALGVAQPTVSENITALEAKLQTRLAKRGHRGAVLTEAGQHLANRGRELIAAAHRLAADVRQLGEELSGPVAVGLPPSLGLLLTVPLTETVFSEMPDVRLRIVEGLSGNILDWIESEAVDFGFVYEVPDPAVFDAVPIMEEDLFLLAAPDNMPAVVDSSRPNELPFRSLRHLPLVMPGWLHGSRRVVERLARASGIRLTFAGEIDSLPQIVEMVRRASAYAIVPHAAVVSQVASGDLALIRIVDPVCRRTAYSVRKRVHGTKAASLAIEATIVDIVRELVARHDLRARILTT